MKLLTYTLYVAILLGDLVRERFVLPQQLRFSFLLLWLPLCCYSINGLSYPILSRFEKMEMERSIDAVIDTLPSTDQEVILTNWLQDYAISNSDWPNLQDAYDRWCHGRRKLVQSSQLQTSRSMDYIECLSTRFVQEQTCRVVSVTVSCLN